ncbi:hypothetical protein DFP72DRAFT_1175729 [Ephemerocybe angulata]|uniref:Fungal-type protein kinase domain-containing protein n=1 Tax=Ephemerocybe angulata TaxID=980116 RepID=A0A8H6HH01_9AGAR|nr:hypothetical protein DFP72DRAFT_1175729 [Tulosesus angulatus]
MAVSSLHDPKILQTRIHWTRARARAAKATPSDAHGPPNPPPLPKRAKPVKEKPGATKPPTPIIQPRSEDPYRDAEFKRLKDVLMQELGEKVHVVSEEWMESMYCDLVDQASLDRYIASEGSGYKVNKDGEGRWTELPRIPKQESELYRPLSAILSRLLKDFDDRPGGDGVSREVVSSHDPKSTFRYEDLKDLCPDISIVATGPSFERDAEEDQYIVGIGYSNVASVVEVKLDEDLGSATFDETEQVAQLAFYCKNIFTKQPNRNFVRSMILTENHARLVHYDRGGFYISPLINIHRNPRTFIRLALGSGAQNEQILGLDTTVQWKTDRATGKKISGTIEATDADGLSVVYQINMSHSPFVRPEIKSRGTTCWHATDPRTGQEVFVKDAWRETNKTSEYSYLKAAQGIDGVVQTISFKDDCATTMEYRPEAILSETFQHKTKSRLIVQRYGKSIEHFTSRYQAIAGLRDAIAAHRDLLSKSVLHRDVSVHNILLGAENAPPGRRGILIDLDMATWTFKDASEQRTEAGVGVRRFQSSTVLWGLLQECPPLHDYLDDLESFFYVLCHLVLLWDRPGKRDVDMDRTLRKWEHEEDLTIVIDAKAAICCSPCLGTSPWWGDACDTLVEAFREIVWAAMLKKILVRRNTKIHPEERRQRLEAIAKVSGDIYGKVLTLFDDALASFEQEDSTSPEVVAIAPTCPTPIAPIVTPAPTPSIAAPVIAPSETANVGTNLKRRLEVDNTDALAPPPKRSRTSALPKPKKRAQQTRPDTSLSQPIRRSARLNRS